MLAQPCREAAFPDVPVAVDIEIQQFSAGEFVVIVVVAVIEIGIGFVAIGDTAVGDFPLFPDVVVPSARLAIDAVAALVAQLEVGGVDPVSYTHLTPADERSSVDLGGRRIIKKKTQMCIRAVRTNTSRK